MDKSHSALPRSQGQEAGLGLLPSEQGTRPASRCHGWVTRRSFCTRNTVGSALLRLGEQGVAELGDRGSSPNPSPTTDTP